VEEHAAEQRHHEQHTFNRGRGAADLVVTETDPGQKQKKGDVDTNVGAGEPGDFERPAHKG
jgi:hypothetical protein